MTQTVRDSEEIEAAGHNSLGCFLETPQLHSHSLIHPKGQMSLLGERELKLKSEG
jgi:hypothetical protein